MRKKILVFGNTSNVLPLAPYFKEKNIETVVVNKFNLADEAIKGEIFDGIVFLLPQYWQDVSKFIIVARKTPGYELIPILYIGSLIEGGEQGILHQQGVKTLTLGPVPEAEVVRYIAKEL